MNRTAFNAWMKDVDEAVQDIAGLSVHDLADQPFADWFEDDVPADEAAEMTLEDEGFPF